MKISTFTAAAAFALCVANLGISGAYAASPMAQRELSASVAMAPDRDTPARVSPESRSPSHLPGWSSGFLSVEQLRNEMLSHGNWGSG